MNKQLLASAIALSVLAGCSSTPPVNEEVSAEIQANIDKIKLNGTLVRQQDSFVLAPTLTVDRADNNGMMDTTQWRFNGKTLFPAFKSERFECRLSENECAQYEESGSPFLKVSATDSDYGDTYEKRVADGKKPGMSAGKVAMTGAAAVIVGPALVLVGAPLTLINGTANLISHGSVWNNKWVEFDHDSFYERTVAAIHAKHGSLENYVGYMASASIAYSELTRYNESLYAEWNSLKADKLAILNKYQPVELTSLEKYNFELPAYGDIQLVKNEIESQLQVYYDNSRKALLSEYDQRLASAKEVYVQQQKAAFDYAKNAASMMSFIKKYKELDEAQLISQAKTKWSTLVKREQKVAFDNIKSIGDANNFIATYQYKDEAKLVAKARDMIARAEKRIQKEKIKKRKVALAALESWRKDLSVGDQTFCGRVIEAKYPMFQIAISHPLQGFSDTIWLEKDKVFEPWSGCNNRNNQLTPLTNPLG